MYEERMVADWFYGVKYTEFYKSLQKTTNIENKNKQYNPGMSGGGFVAKKLN